MQTETLAIATGAFVEDRDDWPDAVARAVRERWQAIELTAVTERLYAGLESFLRESAGALTSFSRVSLHAPAVLDSSPAEVAEALVGSRLRYDVVLHPDVFAEEQALADLGRRALFENMDVNKAFGREPADLEKVFGRFPEAGLCLDVAHVWTNDRSLGLGIELLRAFGDRLRQVHLSGIEADGTHRPTTAEDLELYEPLLSRCAHVPWVLESELVS